MCNSFSQVTLATTLFFIRYSLDYNKSFPGVNLKKISCPRGQGPLGRMNVFSIVIKLSLSKL